MDPFAILTQCHSDVEHIIHYNFNGTVPVRGQIYTVDLFYRRLKTKFIGSRADVSVFDCRWAFFPSGVAAFCYFFGLLFCCIREQIYCGLSFVTDPKRFK
jgi:hypothetical protein